MHRALAAAVGLFLLAGSARAHPSPAEPPAFYPDDCIIVIDKGEQTSFHLDYAVLADDIEFEVDHVSLPDSKTHQFFALSGTLLARATGHAFVLFDDEQGSLRTMPTWLNADDVTRTAAGVKPEDMTMFTTDQVEAGDILDNDRVLSAAVRPLVAGTARVPITEAQAIAGVDWDLTDVPPGAYQIAAYIFSPPHNGWEARRGLIYVVDGSSDAELPPAITLESGAGRLFAGQGRRVRGCVEAPDGSVLELSARVQSEVPEAFEPRLMEPVSAGAFELCLPNEGLDAVLELRVTVRTPSELFAGTQSIDGLSLFSNEAACTESAALCCPEIARADAGAPTTDAATPMTPTAPQAGADAALSGEAPPVPDAAIDEGARSPAPMAAAPAAASCQCSIATRDTAPALSALLALCTLCALRRRRAQGSG